MLTGKIGLVAGVANKRSIAWAIAQAWHKAGATLVFTYQGERLKENVEELAGTFGTDTLVLPCDVSKDEEITRTFARVKEKFGKMHLLLHSVAFAPKESLEGVFIDTTREAFRVAHDVSVYSLIALARESAALMTEGGSILAMTYYGSEKVVPHYNVMGVAKASLEASTRYLAYDLGPRKIRVNCISAGPVNTLAARGISGFSEMMKHYEAHTPLKRNVLPDELGATGAFLAGDGAAAITGQVIYVDCGYQIMGDVMSDDVPLWLLARVNFLQTWRRIKTIHSTSGLLASSIGLFVVAYLTLSFLLFQRGLHFLSEFPALGEVLTERLFYLLFVFLLVLLLFSNLVIGYTNFFRNRETHYLTSLPISSQTIFRWKFLESVALASWAFVFLIAPLLAAYGLTRGAPWHFYVMTVAALAMFIVLPGVAGAWAALNLARYLDRRSFQVIALTVTLALLTLMAIWFRPETLTDNSTDTRVLATLDKLLMRTHFSEWPGLPSFWLSTGVLQWADGAVTAAGFFLLVMLSHVLFFGYLAFTQTGKLFYEAFSTVQSRESIFSRWKWFRQRQRRRVPTDFDQHLIETILQRIHRGPADARALLVKDVRVFWRDTTQWGQTLVLFGLLGVYVINLRHFSQELTNPFWKHLVCYLNLGACALNLATLTTRFVFPQFSLEGKRLWIVGMAPMGVVEALRAKFWLASRAALVVTVALIWLSCHMLKMPLDRTVYLELIIATMTFALTALAMGLGALYPNFREDNPAKIVSGFGGTLCLVLSFLYIVASVTLLAMGSPWGWRGEASVSWILTAWFGFAALSVVVGWAPFWLGLRRVRTVEL